MQNETESAAQSRPTSNGSEIWSMLRERIDSGTVSDGVPMDRSGEGMEANLCVLRQLDQAPARTSRAESLARSSPLGRDVRAMFEERSFGRRFDFCGIDLDAVPLPLPELECPEGEVTFLASDRSLDDLSFSVDCLLQQRKRLLSRSMNPELPRRHVLVIGAGPGGLMAAIELRLRDHSVVVCEQREIYTRNRVIGVFKEVVHLMASLGMPERMTYDLTRYRGKRGIMLADIQTFLHAIALKLGVVIYTGATIKTLSRSLLLDGEIELQRNARSSTDDESPLGVGMTRWHYDTVARVRSGVHLRFDTVIDASGGRSGLREIAVGRDNVVSMRDLAKCAVRRDPTLQSYFEDENDHGANIVRPTTESEIETVSRFADALAKGDDQAIPDQLPCFVSNIDGLVFKAPIETAFDAGGPSARIAGSSLEVPKDWIIVECPTSALGKTRYHIEGPLPRNFAYGEARLATADVLESLNPVGLLLRILYAIGVPFDAIDRQRLIDFYDVESSAGDARDIVATWVGMFRGLRVGGEQPIVWGRLPGSGHVEYGVIGEALQNAWYRFGIGVDDTFAAAICLAESMEFDAPRREQAARRLEKKMLARAVHVMYHLYTVARNTDIGVVGHVLTEHYLDERHSFDLAEMRLKEQARLCSEILAAARDVGGGNERLSLAMHYQYERACRRILDLLGSLAYDAEILRQAKQIAVIGRSRWLPQVAERLAPLLSQEHRALLLPILEFSDESAKEPDSERIVEIALGRYRWASSWIRACAICALRPELPDHRVVLEQAVTDEDELVAEAAAAIAGKRSAGSSAYTVIDKVDILGGVNIFAAIPNETLAGIATLLSERHIQAGERIISKGEIGDCLYVIAEGSVRVHDDAVTFTRIGRCQVVGELALLDAEPRSAHVTALEPTILFQLQQSDFYAVMAERPEIGQCVIKVLCAMVRERH